MFQVGMLRYGYLSVGQLEHLAEWEDKVAGEQREGPREPRQLRLFLLEIAGETLPLRFPLLPFRQKTSVAPCSQAFDIFDTSGND